MCFMTVGGVIQDDKTVCKDICKFSTDDKQFEPWLNLHDVYKEIGPKMGFQATVIGKCAIIHICGRLIFIAGVCHSQLNDDFKGKKNVCL